MFPFAYVMSDLCSWQSKYYSLGMIKNRSVPADTVLPHLVYQDLPGALDWLTGTFGFSEHYRYGEPISGAQVYLGKAYIMLKGARPTGAEPLPAGPRGHYLTVFVEDVDAHYEGTKSAGAEIVEELYETRYGERQYGVKDVEGHFWLFSKHVQDLSPADWGATIASR